MAQTDDWRDQGESVAAVCRRLLPSLVGVYVHGSAALGGMTSRSDLDVLVVAESADGAGELAHALLVEASSPRPLELSVIASAAAVRPREPWPFLVHVNSAESRVTWDAGDGDPDLIAHCAVARAAGIALHGPDPADVVGPVERDQLLDYFASELHWGVAEADQRYAVLNACRAVAFAESQQLMSKMDGASWWAANRGHDPVVDEARAAQSAGTDLGPAGPAAHAFVTACAAQLRAER